MRGRCPNCGVELEDGRTWLRTHFCSCGAVINLDTDIPYIVAIWESDWEMVVDL